MTCEEAGELLGAYALDALPPADARALEAHLASCTRHAADLRDLRDLRMVARAMPALADASPPPPALRARILSAVAADAPGGTAGLALPRAAGEPVRIRPGSATQRRISLASRGWLALAAAVAAAFIGLAAWNIALQRGGQSDPAALAARATSVRTLFSREDMPIGVVLYFADEKKAVLISGNMTPLDAAYTYQMWSIAGQKVESLGLLPVGNDPRGLTVTVPFDGEQMRTLAITVEPAGGSAAPTTAPIMTADCLSAAAPGCSG